MKHLRKNGSRLERILYVLILLSFLLPIGALSIIIATYHSDSALRPLSDYVLMLLECIVGALAIHLPTLLRRKWNVEIPGPLYLLFLIFLYCSITLGEVYSFYYLVPHWDDILHGMSSMMTGLFGFMLITILNRNVTARIHLSHAFVGLFAFCFSVTIGAMWEIYEFTADGLLGLNMQKFMTADGTVLVGHEALTDTMKDLIVDSCGALVSAIAGIFSLRHGGWIRTYLHKPAGQDTASDADDATTENGPGSDSAGVKYTGGEETEPAAHTECEVPTCSN